MLEGSHSKRPSPPHDWLVCLLIALATFGLVVAVSAYLLPSHPSPTNQGTP